MKFIPLLSLLVLSLLTVSACGSKTPVLPKAFQQESAVDQSYLIGHGDILYISVWKEEALTRKTTVLPDGNIIFPLIGEVRAVDRTVTELKTILSKQLDAYVTDLTLSVEVLQPNSMMIYIIGKVNSPGPYPVHENITVMQALTLARGLNPYADSDNIRIFRKLNGSDHIFYFNYEDVSEGKKTYQNIVLKRKDLIVVP